MYINNINDRFRAALKDTIIVQLSEALKVYQGSKPISSYNVNDPVVIVCGFLEADIIERIKHCDDVDELRRYRNRQQQVVAVFDAFQRAERVLP